MLWQGRAQRAHDPEAPWPRHVPEAQPTHGWGHLARRLAQQPPGLARPPGPPEGGPGGRADEDPRIEVVRQDRLTAEQGAVAGIAPRAHRAAVHDRHAVEFTRNPYHQTAEPRCEQEQLKLDPALPLQARFHRVRALHIELRIRHTEASGTRSQRLEVLQVGCPKSAEHAGHPGPVLGELVADAGRADQPEHAPVQAQALGKLGCKHRISRGTRVHQVGTTSDQDRPVRAHALREQGRHAIAIVATGVYVASTLGGCGLSHPTGQGAAADVFQRSIGPYGKRAHMPWPRTHTNTRVVAKHAVTLVAGLPSAQSLPPLALHRHARKRPRPQTGVRKPPRIAEYDRVPVQALHERNVARHGDVGTGHVEQVPRVVGKRNPVLGRRLRIQTAGKGPGIVPGVRLGTPIVAPHHLPRSSACKGQARAEGGGHAADRAARR